MGQKDFNEDEITSFIKDSETTYNCRIAVSLMTVDGKQALDYRSSEKIHPASTIKVPVMIGVMQQIDEKKISLDDTIVVNQTFKSYVDGTDYDAPPSKALTEKLGQAVTIRELLEEMITVSDNCATNLLMTKAGPVNITESNHKLGANGVKVLRCLEDEKAYQAGISNEVTAHDLTMLMAAIDANKAASPESCKTMREVLGRQHYRSMIPAGVPEGVLVGNKTGNITGVDNDTAIVYAPFGHYYLTVMTDQWKDGSKGSKVVPPISKRIYEKLGTARK
ncbi:hypothetical protein BH09SUM1_BH09SUM1_22360 [soil metagenome]